MTPTLWIVLFVVALAVVGAFVWFRRASGPTPPAQPAVMPEDELGALGLSAVRPATAPRIERDPEPVQQPAPTPVASPTVPAPNEKPQPSSSPSLSTVSEARPKAPSPADDAFIASDSPLWPDRTDAVRHLLRSLAVMLGGGVAVLRHEDDAYAIDALIGVPGVRSPRPLRGADHPLHRVPQDTVLSILGPESRQSLRYYADPEAAVGQAVARALAEPPARRVLLVADVPPEEESLSDDALDLIGHYGDLLATLSALTDDTELAEVDSDIIEPDASPTDDRSEEEDSALEADPDTAEDTPDVSPEEEAPGTDEVLPRAVVIQRQLDAAQAADQPLAFALVTLAAADAVLRGDPERVATAEANLRRRLEGAPVVAVEPFGDLMLGAFVHASRDAALAWAAELADTEPPLLVGLVPAATGAPEAIRAAATEALEEAYHQGGGLATVSL